MAGGGAAEVVGAGGENRRATGLDGRRHGVRVGGNVEPAPTSNSTDPTRRAKARSVARVNAARYPVRTGSASRARLRLRPRHGSAGVVDATHVSRLSRIADAI